VRQTDEQSLAPREGPSPGPGVARRLCAAGAVGAGCLAAGFLVSAGFILAWGAPVMATHAAILRGALGSWNGLAETLLKATPLLLVGVGVCAALRSGLWNVGGDGQFILGAVGGAWVALVLPAGLGPVRWPLVLVAAALAGGAWGGLAGALRAWRGANEIIVTVMLNYVAWLLLSYLIRGPLRDPTGYLPMSAELPAALHLPILVSGTRLHAGFPAAVMLALLMWAVFRVSTVGVSMRAAGLAPEAARACGIRVARVQFFSFALAGALAGLGGVAEVAGVHYRLIERLTPGYGFVALAVALLAGGRPVRTAWVSVAVAGLLVGADAAQRRVGIPSSLAAVVIGTFLLAFAAAEPLRRWVTARRGIWG